MLRFRLRHPNVWSRHCLKPSSPPEDMQPLYADTVLFYEVQSRVRRVWRRSSRSSAFISESCKPLLGIRFALPAAGGRSIALVCLFVFSAVLGAGAASSGDIMGRQSSDSEQEARTRKKKKHRNRSSSSSSSGSRTRSHKKSGRRSRSRSRDAYSSSHSYDKRRRRRSSSDSSYSSRRRHSRSRSRDKGKSRKTHKSSRTSRSRSRHRQRSRSRGSDQSSRRRSRSRSNERDRGKGRAKGKTRDRERGKDKDSSSKPMASINIKAALEHLSPAEQAKATLQMVLQAAAKADEALRAKERSEEEAKKRKQEDQALLIDQAKRVKEIEAIESDSFIPQAFRSSRDNKAPTESSDSKHDSAILGTGTLDPFTEEKETDVETMPTAIKYLEDNSIAHPNLYIDKAEAEEKWVQRLILLRQERLMSNPVA